MIPGDRVDVLSSCRGGGRAGPAAPCAVPALVMHQAALLRLQDLWLNKFVTTGLCVPAGRLAAQRWHKDVLVSPRLPKQCPSNNSCWLRQAFGGAGAADGVWRGRHTGQEIPKSGVDALVRKQMNVHLSWRSQGRLEKRPRTLQQWQAPVFPLV